MNPTQIMAFNEITQWIKYKGFKKDDLAQILCAVDKECLKARDITISELMNENGKKMIKFFKNGDKEQLKLVLKMVYKCKNVEQMSNDELAFCYIAKTLESLENFCELAESAETTLESRILKIEDAIKHASSFDEFKAFCLEGSDE